MSFVPESTPASSRYARCIELSERVRWDIDRDVIRGRRLDPGMDFLPEGLARTGDLDFLSRDERRLLTQVQGRTYANMFCLAERFIGCKLLEIATDHALGDQVAFLALVRFTEEELKHQLLFGRIEALADACMPSGYRFVTDSNRSAKAILRASSWAVLAFSCHIELFTQAHYRESLAADETLSPLFKDVFLFHWREESQHAIIDELEWRREDAELTAPERDRAVDEYIGLLFDLDKVLVAQARADGDYFQIGCSRLFSDRERKALHESLLGAYRWQYIASGLKEPRFRKILADIVNRQHLRRIDAAMSPLVGD